MPSILDSTAGHSFQILLVITNVNTICLAFWRYAKNTKQSTSVTALIRLKLTSVDTQA